MNQCSIIGNLTHEPEMKKTQTDIPVCTFTVAVNRRKRGDNEQGDADFFRVSAWRNLGESCAKYLHKGKKVYVSGTVSVRAYTGKDGTARASMEINANDVEFLSPLTANADESYKLRDNVGYDLQDNARHDNNQVLQANAEDDNELPF